MDEKREVEVLHLRDKGRADKKIEMCKQKLCV
jgi:hypothetical protein